MTPAPHRRPARIRQPLSQRTLEFRRALARLERHRALRRERHRALRRERDVDPTREGWHLLADSWPWMPVAAAPAVERGTVEEEAPDPGIAFARSWNACEWRGPG